MAIVDKLILHNCFYLFQSFVEMYSGGRFNGFEGNYFLEREEGYKSKVFAEAQKCLNPSSWHKESIGTGYISECFKNAYKKKGNLIYYQDGGRTEKRINDNIKEAEAVLYDIYLGDNDAIAFEKAVSFFGAKYDLIAYMFFIKNKDTYLPIAPQRFEDAFETLGIDIKLQYNCSWNSYSAYLSIITEIKEEFEKYFSLEISLLDAHSFVWMVNEAKKHHITKEIWLEILQNDSLLKQNDIDILKSFYNAPNHTSTCSSMEEKTGIPVAVYNLAVGKAGNRIAKHLNFKTNYRENGKTRGWSVLFRGQYLQDNHFEWEIKPELAEALEQLHPELLLNQGNIERITKNAEIIANEYEADNEVEREISTVRFVTQSEFKQFVGVPREKPELVETKHGKRYKRDKQRALNALNRAGYLCEYNNDHPTFLRKNANVNYTESHHLIPMAFQDCFPNATLDTESNIVSLCSNCHNQIHYGQGAELIITELYNQRKDALKSEGIDITLEQLLTMYK